ncbi:uncharacterized protein MELLADRAFT_59462 [Melampsora larici-populina 98AG31]|uniref:Uncharacterized protein n=1 Tax=Melampsora larici-populina (strain 98AG31 / pathotype 3-4-7) TaxID=747676 RepID=F4R7K5_MELLP|nr:uncharacterized protein MELLADRAFT_59462 [Melampsora larici-populina 98AG31]EGG11329.1 hypothetical protein MELLADRAFT_59462 [Melampsora larici-populina 98AG31]
MSNTRSEDIFGEVERLSTLVEEMKKEIELLDCRVTDLQESAGLEYQRSRAHEVVLQKLIEASPAHSHIDLLLEIENYSPERHRSETRMDAFYDYSSYDNKHTDVDHVTNPPTTVTSDPEHQL